MITIETQDHMEYPPSCQYRIRKYRMIVTNVQIGLRDEAIIDDSIDEMRGYAFIRLSEQHQQLHLQCRIQQW